MHLHIHSKNFRVLLALGIVGILLVIFFIKNSSRQKKDYPHLTGRLTYLDSKLGDLPYHEMGKYRYAQIEGYPYPFEIYADEQGPSLDSLKKGDKVTAWFYETNNTRDERINRFLQYLEKDKKLYFKRTGFTANLGYVLIALILGALCLFYWFYKKNKIAW
jgi:hypothetical protein